MLAKSKANFVVGLVRLVVAVVKVGLSSVIGYVVRMFLLDPLTTSILGRKRRSYSLRPKLSTKYSRVFTHHCSENICHIL